MGVGGATVFQSVQDANTEEFFVPKVRDSNLNPI